MSLESETRVARYTKVVKKADKVGRVIGVRRLKPSEQTRLAGMTAELTGYDEIGKNPDTGEAYRVPHRMPLMIAAAVCLIDEAVIPFPRNRGELDAIFDRLDVEGLEAAGEGVKELADDVAITVQEAIGEAKN